MYLVFDIGGTYIKYALIDTNGNISKKNKTPTPDGYEATKENFLNTLTEIYKESRISFHWLSI